MNERPIKIKRALISVSNKEGIVELAKGLSENNIEIISTGGTKKIITDSGLEAKDVSDLTGFPEMMSGRVKTLHPLIHGGILGLRDEHAKEATLHNIPSIDLVIVNLYPFSKTIKNSSANFDEIIENIDIGGPTMIRSAAKNMGWVVVIVDPSDYKPLLDEINKGGVSFETRKRLATKAFGHTAQYDTIIHNHLKEEKFSADLSITYKKLMNLRYGENSHQESAAYIEPNYSGCSVLNTDILQGKELSYNNINDSNGALAILKEFSEPACVVVKHANPCGVATGKDITAVFNKAYQADAMSAFGGIIAINRNCNKDIAEAINSVYVELVMAPSFDDEAIEILAQKKNLRVLKLKNFNQEKNIIELRQVEGGLLLQDTDTNKLIKDDLKFPTKIKPTEQELADMLFGWKVLKHVKSNAILIAKNNTTIGIGPGQVSRVDAVKIAIRKSEGKISGSVLCSDAFFPFRDSIDTIATTGIKAIIQPGGSIKDKEVIDACNEHKIAMVFTGVRCFKH